MKRDLEIQAKQLKDQNPQEAINIYKTIWNDYNSEFNHWDAFFVIGILRQTALNFENLNWAFELAEKYSDEKVSSLLGWLLIDNLKKKKKQEILQYETYVKRLSNVLIQKNLRASNEYPCPLTICVFKLLDAYTENLFNARKILEFIELINPEYLSTKVTTLENTERGDVELASDLEKYYALKTKALFKINEFQTCIDVCNEALASLEIFHYNNDTWFKMRLGLSLDKIGEHEQSEQIFNAILSSKAGNDKWFLYRDLSEIYFEQQDYIKSWSFAVTASLLGKEPHYLIGLFYLQTRILYKLKRQEDGLLLAKMIGAILKEQNWNRKQEYQKLFDFYKIDFEALKTVKDLHFDLKKFWKNERYSNLELKNGKIISIHSSGKKGRIKDESNTLYNFKISDFEKRVKNLNELNKASVTFYPIRNVNGEFQAESIKVISSIKNLNNFKVGDIINGQVQSVKNFGVFVKLNENTNGLIHANAINNNLDAFTVGSEIEVKVDRITDKGINLLPVKIN